MIEQTTALATSETASLVQGAGEEAVGAGWATRALEQSSTASPTSPTWMGAPPVAYESPPESRAATAQLPGRAAFFRGIGRYLRESLDARQGRNRTLWAAAIGASIGAGGLVAARAARGRSMPSVNDVVLAAAVLAIAGVGIDRLGILRLSAPFEATLPVDAIRTLETWAQQDPARFGDWTSYVQEVELGYVGRVPSFSGSLPFLPRR